MPPFGGTPHSFFVCVWFLLDVWPLGLRGRELDQLVESCEVCVESFRVHEV